MGSTDYVVTYKFESGGHIGFYEFFRDPKEECERIASTFGGATNDATITKASKVIVGPAKEWDEFLSEQMWVAWDNIVQSLRSWTDRDGDNRQTT